MASEVQVTEGKEFTFEAPKKGGAGKQKYPWDTWFDGRLLKLDKDAKDEATGEVTKHDFDCDVKFMPVKIKMAARRKYKVVQTTRYSPDGVILKDSIILRARPMTDDERQAEDILRAEEKEAKKANKKSKATATPTAQATDAA